MARVRGNLWAVVLAGGEGRRLAPLTQLLYGQDLPKQFAVLAGRHSLLQSTLERLARVVPGGRTVVVAPRAYAETARTQLAAYPGVDLVLQPRNLGTGPGLLLPLARILARERGARVAVFPSDHHIARPERLAQVVLEAADEAARGRARLLLLGAVPTGAETDYGWILPGASYDPSRPLRAVDCFVEKPTAAVADRLLRSGALWNTFILVGRLAEFWAQLRTFLLRQTQLFELYSQGIGAAQEGEILDHVYSEVEAADFSRDVLQRARGLGVLPLPSCDWSDLGTPARVLASIRSRELLARLRQATLPPCLLDPPNGPEHASSEASELAT